MENKEIHRKNHYVPQVYLKNWSHDEINIFAMRTLVNDERVPVWKKKSIKGMAMHENLYVRIDENREETDEFERWFDREIEDPAKSVLEKIKEDKPMDVEEQRRLLRFMAAQYIRTPYRYLKEMDRAQKIMPELMERTLKKVMSDLEQRIGSGEDIRELKPRKGDSEFPLKAQILLEEGQEFLRVDTLLGRCMWLSEIKHVISNTAQELFQHEWSIIKAPDGIKWPTSDDPVICLNYYSCNNYNFNGGWGKKGSKIIFPVSPSRILYTQVGTQQPEYKEADVQLALFMKKIIAEHAYRWIYSDEEMDLSDFRTREVSVEKYKMDEAYWTKWDAQQNEKEMKFFSTN